MSSLHDSVIALEPLRLRSLDALVAPQLERLPPDQARIGLERAVLEIAVAVFAASNRTIREALLLERRRFRAVTEIVYRLPARPRGGE